MFFVFKGELHRFYLQNEMTTPGKAYYTNASEQNRLNYLSHLAFAYVLDKVQQDVVNIGLSLWRLVSYQIL